MQRKTKIVATMGPACASEEKIARLFRAGVNVVRLNFSHGTSEAHIQHAKLVRDIAEKMQIHVGILCDLQGPKVRIGKFEHQKILLKSGDLFVLDADCTLGDQHRVGLDYKSLPREVKEGTILLLDDGRITMEVNRVQGNQIYCVVLTSGELSNNKGINLQGGGLAAEALTSKDIADIQTAVALQADYIAISFPRDAQDMERARALVQQAGGNASLVAKIERAEAIDHLEAIIEASDVVMVARGDLGVEMGDAAIPGLQKRIIRLARAANKLVITATQMLESMIHSPIPTRAEVSDVANAVLDGTDAVMLSAETASGNYPVEAVEAMHRVCLEAEKEYEGMHLFERRAHVHSRVDEAIAAAAVFTSRHYPVKAIVALTVSGNSAQWLSRADCFVPIYAMSPDIFTRRKLTLHRNVFPFEIIQQDRSRDEIFAEIEKILSRAELVQVGEEVLVTYGEPFCTLGGTNSLKVITIGINE
ncbi:MAG: pyruvate kinase [Methylophilales bacterium 16-45-7]|nr:MAG: pyruvate kinase [Methylophilales bacterium 16-45-7]